MLRRVTRCPLTSQLVGDIADRVGFRVGENRGCAERAFDRGAREEGTGGVRGEGRDVQAFDGRAIPVRGAGGVFERDAAAGEVLGEASPWRKVEFCRGAELREVAFET